MTLTDRSRASVVAPVIVKHICILSLRAVSHKSWPKSGAEASLDHHTKLGGGESAQYSMIMDITVNNRIPCRFLPWRLSSYGRWRCTQWARM